MDYANIVRPEEMEESRRFLEEMVRALTAKADVRAELNCVAQGWGTLQEGCSCDGAPLVLAGRPFASGLGTHAAVRSSFACPPARNG